MSNWNITKRDLEQIIRLQEKTDKLLQKYTQKYGMDDDLTPLSDVARCLDQAVAGFEELIEHTT